MRVYNEIKKKPPIKERWMLRIKIIIKKKLKVSSSSPFLTEKKK